LTVRALVWTVVSSHDLASPPRQLLEDESGYFTVTAASIYRYTPRERVELHIRTPKSPGGREYGSWGESALPILQGSIRPSGRRQGRQSQLRANSPCR